MKWSIWLICMVLAGCGSKKFYENEGCRQANASRCGANDTVEECGPNGYWMTVMDCGAVGTNWVCGVKDNDHTCIRKTK